MNGVVHDVCGFNILVNAGLALQIIDQIKICVSVCLSAACLERALFWMSWFEWHRLRESGGKASLEPFISISNRSSRCKSPRVTHNKRHSACSELYWRQINHRKDSYISKRPLTWFTLYMWSIWLMLIFLWPILISTVYGNIGNFVLMCKSSVAFNFPLSPSSSLLPFLLSPILSSFTVSTPDLSWPPLICYYYCYR